MRKKSTFRKTLPTLLGIENGKWNSGGKATPYNKRKQKIFDGDRDLREQLLELPWNLRSGTRFPVSYDRSSW